MLCVGIQGGRCVVRIAKGGLGRTVGDEVRGRVGGQCERTGPLVVRSHWVGVKEDSVSIADGLTVWDRAKSS